MFTFKRFAVFFILLFIAVSGYKAFAFFQDSSPILDFTSQKAITVNDNGFDFTVKTSAATIADFLEENKISLGDQDQIIPEKNSPLFPGENIAIRRAVEIKIKVDGNTMDVYTLAASVGGAISENKITLNRLDKVSPDINAPPQNGQEITVTRINVEETTIQEDIDFKTIQNSDNQMGWHEQKITQTGVKGTQEVRYRITYKNGEEISRVALEKDIVTQPISQIVTQGTYMQLGKADKGQGTWYSYQGGLFAASTTIPRGSYAKVTNTANGQSVIVQINDYGPFGKGRIIDLDKVAFQKIAPIGAGVIGVKVEQVLN